MPPDFDDVKLDDCTRKRLLESCGLLKLARVCWAWHPELVKLLTVTLVQLVKVTMDSRSRP